MVVARAVHQHVGGVWTVDWRRPQGLAGAYYGQPFAFLRNGLAVLAVVWADACVPACSLEQTTVQKMQRPQGASWMHLALCSVLLADKGQARGSICSC